MRVPLAQHFIKIFIMIALYVLLTSPVWGVIEKHPRKAVPVMIYDQLETAQPSKENWQAESTEKKKGKTEGKARQYTHSY